MLAGPSLPVRARAVGRGPRGPGGAGSVPGRGGHRRPHRLHFAVWLRREAGGSASSPQVRCLGRGRTEEPARPRSGTPRHSPPPGPARTSRGFDLSPGPAHASPGGLGLDGARGSAPARGSAGVRPSEVQPAPGSRTPGGAALALRGEDERGWPREKQVPGLRDTWLCPQLPLAPAAGGARGAWGDADCPERSGTAAGGAREGGGAPGRGAGGARGALGPCPLPLPRGCGAGPEVPVEPRRSSRSGDTCPCLPAELPPSARSAARPLMFHRGSVPQLTHTGPRFNPPRARPGTAEKTALVLVIKVVMSETLFNLGCLCQI